MSTVTARYVSTCLSDYLQDGYTRNGQELCLASLGSDLATTVESLYDSIDDCCGFPSDLSPEQVCRALRTAIEGVDLRYIDEDGMRCEEPPEDRDSEEPYLYVVVEWVESDASWLMALAGVMRASTIFGEYEVEKLEKIARRLAKE